LLSIVIRYFLAHCTDFIFGGWTSDMSIFTINVDLLCLLYIVSIMETV